MVTIDFGSKYVIEIDYAIGCYHTSVRANAQSGKRSAIAVAEVTPQGTSPD